MIFPPASPLAVCVRADVRDGEECQALAWKNLAAAIPEGIGFVMAERKATEIVIHDPAPPVTIRVHVIRRILSVEPRQRRGRQGERTLRTIQVNADEPFAKRGQSTNLDTFVIDG